MAKNEKVAANPVFNKGMEVFSVLGGKLTIVKSIMPKHPEGVIAYMVKPQRGETYRATEGELSLTSPYAAKRPRRSFDYDNEGEDQIEDFGTSPMGQGQE